MLTSTLRSLALLVMVLAPGVLLAPTMNQRSIKDRFRWRWHSKKPCPQNTTDIECPPLPPRPELQPQNGPPQSEPPKCFQTGPASPTNISICYGRPRGTSQQGGVKKESVTITFGQPKGPGGAKQENTSTSPAQNGTETEHYKSTRPKCNKNTWDSDDDSDDSSDDDSDSDDDDSDDDSDHWW
ncbi:hypothetical protein QBC39DRAFT_349274 [Podospora conica]|nr:hypothetical protein QBC39DRAFT_349274 [Schizothecium conicum]